MSFVAAITLSNIEISTDNLKSVLHCSDVGTVLPEDFSTDARFHSREDLSQLLQLFLSYDTIYPIKHRIKYREIQFPR